MAEKTIKQSYGEIYLKTNEAVNDGKKVVIHKGGTGSGKTYDIMIFLLFNICLTQKNQIITVVSESKPHLDIGVIRILKGLAQPLNLWRAENWNISKSIFTYQPTGSIIEFFSADRIDKALGARRDWLYGNEINSLKLEVWDELARRSENVIADFNPTSQFWLEDWLQNYDDTTVITSNYLDNPFLPETEKGRIEKRAERDENFRRIHIDCEYGVYEGLVFENWAQVEKMPDAGKETFGMDFGFTNDPTTLIKIIETETAFFLDELIYQTGMLNREIIARLQSLGLKKNYDKIIADSAEPKTIHEIYLAGYNIHSAQKGADSIRAGIERLKNKDIFITKRSVNLIREFRNYRYEVDKFGKPTNKPIDSFNHGIDAVRYGTEKSKETTPIDKLQGIFY